MANEIQDWEDEGGSVPTPAANLVTPMSGTENQVEWAERIRLQVDAEFDRVAAAFQAVADNQSCDERSATEAIIAILNEKRIDVMSRTEAGYFVHGWQEITDQVRQMIFRDARYQAIKTNKAARSVLTDQPSKQEIRTSMNIRPLYDRIVVKRLEEEETTHSGIIIPDSAKEKPQQGEVLAVGHGKRLADGTLIALDVKAGDRILFGKYAGSETKLDGAEYIILREDDVLGVLDPGTQAARKPQPG